MTRINRVNLSAFVQHYFLSGLPKKIAKQDFLGKGDDGFNMVKAGGNAHALQTKNHQRRSRLRKCSFTTFSSFEVFVGNSHTSDEEPAQMTTGAYNEVRDRGMRKGDEVSRDGYFQLTEGGRWPPSYYNEVIV